MSEPLASDSALSRPLEPSEDKTMPVVVYVLYLLGFATGFVTTVIGAVMAYAIRKGASERVRSHYVFLIRTAWISLLWLVVVGMIFLIGLPLTVILIGFLFWWIAGAILTLIGVWFVLRCVVGLIFLSRGEAYPRPQAWII
jgi:uncharacterized membrane protein